MLGAALVAALVLGGCATVTAPEPGFSDEEWAEYVHAQADVTWGYLGFAPDLQPADSPVVVVSSAEYPAKYAECMNDAGFDRYHLDGSIETDEDGLIVMSDAEWIASFDCSTHLSLSSHQNGTLNRAQREYAYDYYEQVLVPCLMNHGVELYEVPSREEFHASLGVWNPYISVRGSDLERVTADEELRSECLPVPPGIPNNLTYGYYG